MAKFAVGKHAFGICDRSGFRYKLNEMRKEWNGLLVGRDMWERKHPQLEPRRKVSDAQALRQPRPDVAEGASSVLLGPNPFYLLPSSLYAIDQVKVHHPNHGKSTNDIVVFTNAVGVGSVRQSFINRSVGHKITVIDSDYYTFNGFSRINLGNTAKSLNLEPLVRQPTDTAFGNVKHSIFLALSRGVSGFYNGDINNDGDLNAEDGTILNNYFNNIEIQTSHREWIEEQMIPFWIEWYNTQDSYDHRPYWWNWQALKESVLLAKFNQFPPNPVADALWRVPVPNSITSNRVLGHLHFGGAPNSIVDFTDGACWQAVFDGYGMTPYASSIDAANLNKMKTHLQENMDYMEENLDTYGQFLYQPNTFFNGVQGGGKRVTVGV